MNYVHTPQSFCRFAVARCDITPPVGIYHRMWGAATHDRATGVHRPLSASALVFQPLEPQHAGRVILVAVDHCLLAGTEMESLRQAVAARCHLPQKEELIITFSHSHSAGFMGLDRRELPGGELIPQYLNQLADSISSIVTEAISHLAPVTISYGSGRSSLGANRDFWDATTNQFVCGFNPDGIGDDTVLVARACDSAGNIVATMVNYACHPTTLAWQNTLISPDYPGAMRELVEQATRAPCIFLQGASGDIGPREGYVGDVNVAECNGRILGYAALSTLESLPPPATRFEYTGPVVSGATLGTWAHQPIDGETRMRCGAWALRRFVVDLPYRPDLPRLEQAEAERKRWTLQERESRESGDETGARDARAMAERMKRVVYRLQNLPAGNTFPMPVTLWRIGDCCWLAVESEHYNWLQRSLRERFRDNPIVVMTLANGARATYLPTRESYGRGIYQESIALLAPGSLEQLVDAIGSVVEEVTGSR